MHCAEHRLERLRILIADDVEANRMVATALVQGLGHRAESVGNGAEAVERVRSGSYDLVLMDIDMPILNGYDATRGIRAMVGEQGDVPIFALSGRADGESRREATRAGMSGFLQKPLRMNGLAQALQDVALRSAPNPAHLPGAVVSEQRAGTASLAGQYP